MTEEEFKEKLNPEQFRVMRGKDTERPYSGKYWDNNENGIYSCAACGRILFLSLSKFDAENGWPCFSSSIDEKNIEIEGSAGGKEEVLCKNCGSHLGYINEDGRGNKEKKYFCINSAALVFNKLPDIEKEEKKSEENEEDEKTEKAKSRVEKQKFSIQSISALLAVALGAGALGVGAGLYVCKNAQSTSIPPIVAATTTPSPSPATIGSSQIIQSVINSAPRSTSTPSVATTTANTSDPALLTATSSPTGTSFSDIPATSSSAGTP